MNTERFNPHLDQRTRERRMAQVDFENKENDREEYLESRDCYALNNPNAVRGTAWGRTRFVDLNFKKRKK